MVDNIQSLWNFDDKVSEVLATLKANFLSALYEWNLESAYFNVRLLWVESEAKLKKEGKHYAKEEGGELELSELEKAKYEIDKLEKSRAKYLEGQISRGDFYYNLETFYRLICNFMKQNGLYYREGHDASKAALRR